MNLLDCINLYITNADGERILLSGAIADGLKLNFIDYACGLILSLPHAARDIHLARFSKKRRVRKKNKSKLSTLKIDIYL